MAFKSGILAVPTTQRDDADVRITRWDFEPGAITGEHTHEWPYVVVMLTDAIIRVDDGSDVTKHLCRRARPIIDPPASSMTL